MGQLARTRFVMSSRGDATPTSQVARLFGMSVIIIGTASFAVALGTLLGPVIQARFAKLLGRRIALDESRRVAPQMLMFTLGY